MFQVQFRVLLIVVLSCAATELMAATYYVDYQGGDDKANGTAAEQAWKHCPSDLQATERAAATNLQGGDVIIFKGGVRYRGMIDKPFSGSAEKPIIYDGNSAGTFGSGAAIIDGSLALTNWQQCKNAAEASGNQQFKEIWYTDVAHTGGWRGLNLLGAEVPMHVSQHPNPSDPLFQERVSEYQRSKQSMTRKDNNLFLSDPEHLADKTKEYFDGMTLCFHGGHNAAVHVDILDFDPATATLTTKSFTDHVSKGKLYKTGTKYCLFNSVKIIDQAGEYAMQRLDDKRVRVFAWPSVIEDGQPKDISRSAFAYGFHFDGVNHVRVRGFKVERQGGKKAHGIYLHESKDIAVQDCEISQVRGSAGFRAFRSEQISVADSYIHHLPGHTFGLFVRSSKDVEVRRTRIFKPTSTGLDFYGVTNGVVSQCEISGHTGMHANGMTFYLGNRGLLIERNYVHSGNIPMTIKQSGDVIIRNNILDGNNSSMSIGMWSTSGHEKQYWSGATLQNVQVIHNVLINGSTKNNWARGIFSNMKDQPENLIVKNNILAGASGKVKGTYAHNIFTNPVNKSLLTKGSVVITDLDQIFVDHKNNDFRLKKGSPAIAAGTDLGVEEDFAGNARVKGSAPSIGAYFAK